MDPKLGELKIGFETSPYNTNTHRLGYLRRPFRFLRSRSLQRLALLLTLWSCLQFYLLHGAYTEAIAAKHAPTIFTRLSDQEVEDLAAPRWRIENVEGIMEDRHKWRKRLLDEREQWKRLGSGYEGDTYVWNEVVVKVFKSNRSPMRNFAPRTSPPLPWPPEIPASLLLGGFHDDSSHATRNHSNFVPVLDYFVLPSPDPTHPGEWHLVSPLLTGTLEHLSKSSLDRKYPLSPQELDARFRPSFDDILEALDDMHENHNLCHDDIKMDNIFVDGSRWLLGDLGNVREPSHPYHSSILWGQDNGQLVACKANDVVRLVRTYARFLLEASGSGEGGKFGDAFLTGSAPWSKLYWATVNSAPNFLNGTTAAKSVYKLSTEIFPSVDTAGSMSKEQVLGENGWNSAQAKPVAPSWLNFLHLGKTAFVQSELSKGMSTSERWAVIFLATRPK